MNIPTYLPAAGSVVLVLAVFLLFRRTWLEKAVARETPLLHEELARYRQVKEQLQENERIYRALFRHLSAGFALHEIIIDKKGGISDYRFLAVNPAFEEMTGLKAVDIVGHTALEVLPGLEPEWIEKCGRVAEEGKSVRFEQRFGPQGKIYEVTAFSPEPCRFAAVFTDITGKKEAEKSLLELKAAVDQSADGIALADMDGNIRFVNNTWAVMHGYSAGELMGCHLGVFHTREQLEKEVVPFNEQLLKSGSNHGEVGHLRKDGTTFPAQMVTSVVKDAGGKPVGLLGIARDITERKRAEEQLLESEEKFRALFMESPVSIIIHDKDTGEIVDANKTAFTAYGFTSVEELQFSDFLGEPPFSYCEAFARIRKTAKEGPQQFEWMSRRRTGDIFWERVHLRSMVIGGTQRVLAIATDITEQKQAEEKVRAKNKELESYLYVASHDLKSPLVNIQGFGRRLQKNVDSVKSAVDGSALDETAKSTIGTIIGETIPKTLSYITANVSKIDDLLNGLLKLSRTGRVEMKVRKVDMNLLFESLIKAHKYQLDERDVKVNTGNLAECWGDEGLLSRLFSNLLTNAIKYADKNRTLVVDINSRIACNKVIYSVRDNGIGIPENKVDRIWSIFYRASTEVEKEGEGIGLNIVKLVAEKHKGRAWVESEEGKGSTFHIELCRNEFSE